jgi:site-specific DNA-methyltransferase (adenine-specific)
MTHSLLCNDEQCSEYCPVAILDKQSGNRVSKWGKSKKSSGTSSWFVGDTSPDACDKSTTNRYKGDEGGASRYFAQFQPDAPFIYAPKASRKDRTSDGNVNNTHPTCKSISLMKYMLKLVVPPNGVVLDCFAGSGSTLVAAIHEGFHYIGVEAEAEYIEIINARLEHAHKQIHGDPSCELWAQ